MRRLHLKISFLLWWFVALHPLCGVAQSVPSAAPAAPSFQSVIEALGGKERILGIQSYRASLLYTDYVVNRLVREKDIWRYSVLMVGSVIFEHEQRPSRSSSRASTEKECTGGARKRWSRVTPSGGGCGARLRRRGSSGSSAGLSPRAVPSHPGKPHGCLRSLLHHGCQASSDLERLATFPSR